jgi:hypothetical protein
MKFLVVAWPIMVQDSDVIVSHVEAAKFNDAADMVFAGQDLISSAIVFDETDLTKWIRYERKQPAIKNWPVRRRDESAAMQTPV